MQQIHVFFFITAGDDLVNLLQLQTWIAIFYISNISLLTSAIQWLSRCHIFLGFAKAEPYFKKSLSILVRKLTFYIS